MKGFVVSIILLLVAIAICIFNFFYIHKITNTLDEMINNIETKSNPDAYVSELLSFWEKHKDILSLSTNYKLTDMVGEELIKLKVAAESENEFALRQSAAMLHDIIGDIKQHESFSLGAIF